jgi:hypothetical protein
MNTLTEIQRNTIKDLAELGLVKLQQVILVWAIVGSHCANHLEDNRYYCAALLIYIYISREGKRVGLYLLNWLRIFQ